MQLSGESSRHYSPGKFRRLKLLSRQLCNANDPADTDQVSSSYHNALAHFVCRASGEIDEPEPRLGAPRVTYRAMSYTEFARRLPDIDRSESRTGSYRNVNGKLVLDQTADEVPDWSKDRRAFHSDKIRVCVESNGGVIIGAFYTPPGRPAVLVGCTVLDGQFVGRHKNMLDMYFLFASRTLKNKMHANEAMDVSFRDCGIGTRLITKIAAEAKARGARKLYISCANSEHTIKFYLRRGCVLADEQLAEHTGENAGGGSGYGGDDIQMQLTL